MLDSIPAWVTALSLNILILVVITGVLALLIAPFIGRRLAKGFGDVIGQVLLRVVDGEIEQKTANLEVLKSAEKEAFAMVETLKATELDESIPLKLRKLVLAMRIGQLKHRYESAIVALQYTQGQLTKARHDYSLHGAGHMNMYRDKVALLVKDVEDQEAKIREIEPLLDRYGVDYEKLVRPQLAIVE